MFAEVEVEGVFSKLSAEQAFEMAKSGIIESIKHIKYGDRIFRKFVKYNKSYHDRRQEE